MEPCNGFFVNQIKMSVALIDIIIVLMTASRIERNLCSIVCETAKTVKSMLFLIRIYQDLQHDKSAFLHKLLILLLKIVLWKWINSLWVRIFKKIGKM